MSVPQHITQIKLRGGATFIDMDTADGSVYLQGTGTKLKANDPVLFVFGDNIVNPGDNIGIDPAKRVAGDQIFTHIQKVEPHAAEKYTKVTLPFST